MEVDIGLNEDIEHSSDNKPIFILQPNILSWSDNMNRTFNLMEIYYYVLSQWSMCFLALSEARIDYPAFHYKWF